MYSEERDDERRDEARDSLGRRGKSVTISDRAGKTRKKVPDEGNMPVEHYSDVEKKLIRRYALGFITPTEWEHKHVYHEFAEETYQAGRRERDFFDTYGKLSGNFEDFEERSKRKFTEERATRNYAADYDEDEKDMMVKYARGEITYLTWEELRVLGHITSKVFQEALSLRQYYLQFRKFPRGFTM